MWAEPIHAAADRLPLRDPSDRKVAVLLNANARKVTPRVIRALSHVVPAKDLYLSRSELDARRIATQVVDQGYHTVFMGGGDGTLMCFMNEILNQVRHKGPARAAPRFGVLKLGTGNSVASWLKASPTRNDGMVDDVLRARTGEVPNYRTVDLLDLDGKRAPFAGLGLDGKLLNDYIWVKENLGQGPLSRLLSGPGGYFTSVALKTVPYYLTNPSAVRCVVTNGGKSAYRMGPDGTPAGDPIKPGQTLFEGDLVLAAAGTVPFYGYELKTFPFAAKRRGMFHLRLANVSALDVLTHLPQMWSGTWFNDSIHDFLASDVTVKFDRPMPLQIAGDAEGYREQLRIGVSSESVELADFSHAVH